VHFQRRGQPLGEDYEALRADPCCHYAPAGHEVLAEWLAPALEVHLP